MVKNTKYHIFTLLILLTALILRLSLTKLPSFAGDMRCWNTWSNHIYKVGPSNFYNTAWSDYLPFYLLVLWAIRFAYEIISSFINVNMELLLKMPAILADLAFGYIFYYLGKSRQNKTYGIILCCAYLFSPFSYFNSSIWGHIDAFYSLILFIGLLLAKNGFAKNKIFLTSAGWAFLAAAFLIKPQSIAFIPLVLLTLKPKNVSGLLYGLVVFTATIYMMSYPFFPQDKFNVFANLGKKIISSANTYPYLSANAMNVWGTIGTWEPDNILLWGLEAKVWGLILLTLSLCLIYLIYYTNIITINSLNRNRQSKEFAEWTAVNSESKNLQEEQEMYTFFICCCLVGFSLFALPTRVHERWMFYLFPFLLAALAIKNNFFLWIFYLILSVIHYLNLYFVYIMYYPNHLKIPALYSFLEKNFSNLSAVVALSFLLLMFYTMRQIYKHKKILI